MLEKSDDKALSDDEKNILQEVQNCKENFIEKMDDDLNTADAITSIFDLVKIANTNIDENSSKQLIEKTLSMLNELTKVINIAQTTKDNDIDVEKIEQLIDERNEAKKNKDFAKADEIRDTLKQMGIEIKDTRKGTQWSRI